MQKIFVGPRLRRLRQEQQLTQAQMARALGISTSYVNLLENNERSVSVPVLLKLFEAFGVDWREIAEDDGATRLADLRAAIQDPLFEADRPDLAELRAALAHAPGLARAFLRVHKAYQTASEQVIAVAGAQGGEAPVLAGNPESAVHGFFRENRNHFRALESAAAAFWDGAEVPTDEIYTR
ncbi:MAG: helix-turn-helix domain-containing protein, partial [Deinococcus-Thermus bacterium]|nr:helix-turn-helix domain-containing protein [Deinococcota bacterium]